MKCNILTKYCNNMSFYDILAVIAAHGKQDGWPAFSMLLCGFLCVSGKGRLTGGSGRCGGAQGNGQERGGVKMAGG